MIDLSAIRKRCEAATEGPWDNEDSTCVYSKPSGEPPVLMAQALPEEGGYFTYQQKEANADFIAHARTDVPALLEECERLRKTTQKVAELPCVHYKGGCQPPHLYNENIQPEVFCYGCAARLALQETADVQS